jgi:hypothetical protein
VINDVTAALVAELEADVGPGIVVPSQPGRPGAGGQRIAVFLIRVDRDPERTNEPPERPPPLLGSDEPEPVLPLHLYYMVSADAGEGDQAQITAHALLSRAMRVLMRATPLRVEHLRAGRPAVALVRLSLAALSLEDLSRIWAMLPGSQSFWPSAVYLVTNVDLVGEPRAAGPRVLEAEHRVGVVL